MLFHTPLNYNCTFCDIRRASKHDFFLHPPNQNCTFCDIRQASKHHDFFIYLLIRFALFATPDELRNSAFSHSSQSQFRFFATSDELRNITFCPAWNASHPQGHNLVSLNLPKRPWGHPAPDSSQSRYRFISLLEILGKAAGRPKKTFGLDLAPLEPNHCPDVCAEPPSICAKET